MSAYPTDKLVVVLLALLLLLLLLATARHPHADLLGPAESLGVGGTTQTVGIQEASLTASLAHAKQQAAAVVPTDGDIHQGLLHA